MKILCIETSCDETSASILEAKFKNQNAFRHGKVKILSNIVSSQIDLHKKYGGVFPELASRAHVENIIPAICEALSKAYATQNKSRRRGARLKPSRALRTDFHAGKIESGIFDVAAPSDIDLIAVTIGPGLIGSLLVGVETAKTLAYALKKPIIGINHWLGHIYSNWAEKPFPQFPALVLIVSGGHTGLVLMKSHREIKRLGETLDDAAGEAFDKVAKLLDLGYPGGPAVAAAAAKFKSKNEKVKTKLKNFNFPRSMLDRKDFDFSFSGLKTAVLYMTKKIGPTKTKKYRNQIAAEFQQTVIDILIGKTIQAAYKFRPKSICLCGGVSANKNLREQMGEAIKKLPWKAIYHVPPMELTTDNAAMIGIAGAYHLDQKTTWDKIEADANLEL